MLKVQYNGSGATITSEDELEKAGPILEITDVSVNAHSLYTYTPAITSQSNKPVEE